jgi:target of rapamycin complex 2 subunit MAPKAP1
MPAKARVVFENARTMSWHIKSIAAVQQSSKSSSTFKLLVQRDTGIKRYDFEAESSKLAAEIVSIIKELKAHVDRRGTLRQSRKSRQVV